MQLVLKSATLQGFLATDYGDQYRGISDKPADWVIAGRLRFQLDGIDGIENACEAQKRLFTGANDGQQFLRVTPDPTAQRGRAG